MDVAENIELKSLSTPNLSNIKSSSFFSSEIILEAFVHYCKRHETVNEPSRTNLTLHVSGAGMEYLNGRYTSNSYPNIVHKNVVHNGSSCKAVIHRSAYKNNHKDY